MNKSVKVLMNYGLLGFGRDGAVFDLLKDIMNNAEYKEFKDKSEIVLKTKSAIFKIIIHERKILTSGNVKPFRDELEILAKNCINEFAISVRSKKELLDNLSCGEFFRFVLAPVLMECYNFYSLNLQELCSVMDSVPAVRKFFIFNVRDKLKCYVKKDTLSVLFNNAHFSIKLRKSKPDYSLINRNFEVSKFQNSTGDSFFAGLPYTLKALNGEFFEYSFNGESESLREICRVVLEALYDYLMVENV